MSFQIYQYNINSTYHFNQNFTLIQFTENNNKIINDIFTKYLIR